MTFKTYEINVDLVNDISTTSVIRFSQNDRNSAKLLLTITNKGAELDLSQAKSVRMSFKKPDGTRVFQNDCQPINAMKGKYQILLKTQTLTAVGNVIAQIHIEEEDRIIDTQKFFFIVNDSLASDEAVESTNDFTIIQKALELGEKFKNVDFDPIMAAGELAKGAVKKSGDTMTGHLNFQGTQNNLQWFSSDGATRLFSLYGGGTTFGITDVVNNQNLFNYNSATKLLSFNADTNLVKKTDTYTDMVQPNGNTKTLAVNTDLNTITTPGTYAGSKLVNAPDVDIYFYIEVSRYSDTKYAMQRATTLTGNSNIMGTWVRRMENNAWRPWERLIDSKGGTMTGQLDIQVPTAGSNGVSFKTTTGGDLHKFIGTNTGAVAWQDKVNNIDVFNYSAVNKTLTFLGETNLLKSTGGKISGLLTLERLAQINQDMPTTASARGFNYMEEGTQTRIGGLGLYRGSATEKPRLYLGWGANPWDGAYALTVTEDSLKYKNKDVAMRDKDGRADLALTADAELFTGNTVIADRRGNTVTLRAPFRKKSGGNTTPMFTLPVDMRPTLTVLQNVSSIDGIQGLFVINSNGEVWMQDLGSSSVTGKSFYITSTYVTN